MNISEHLKSLNYYLGIKIFKNDNLFAYSPYTYLLNFFLKWFPIIVRAIITPAIIRKKITMIDVILVDLFIFVFFHIQPMNHHKL